jgi:hypothetical protein
MKGQLTAVATLAGLNRDDFSVCDQQNLDSVERA